MSRTSKESNFKKSNVSPAFPTRGLGSSNRRAGMTILIMIILYIDTTNNKEAVVALEIDGKKDEIRQELDHRRSQVVLPLIDTLLHKHNLTIRDITAIEVNPGPGSFTGIRVGITIAQTLGTTLHIPVNGKLDNYVEPTYQ